MIAPRYVSRELPSARNLTAKNAVELFVPTAQFWETLNSDSNEVIYGTRGSGKTMLLRMMSVPHLLEYSTHDAAARDALSERRRLGVFVPLGIDWCVPTQPHLGDTIELFRNGVNLVAAEAFVDSIEALVRRAPFAIPASERPEPQLASTLATLWFRSVRERIYSFASLRLELLQQQAILRDLWRRGAPTPEQQEGSGYVFRSGDLFFPIAQAVRALNPLLALPSDHHWLLCLDELEDLNADQKRLIATALRSASRGLVFKITTQPYTLDSAETTFADEGSAVEHRDYVVRRLQHDPDDKQYRELVTGILAKRIGAEASEHLGTVVFGDSTFSERASDVTPKFEDLRRGLLSSGNPDSARKKVPVAAIRFLRRYAEGNKKSAAYSGWTTIVRLSDGNPGVFLRMLNELGVTRGTRAVDPVVQHEKLTELAAAWLEWSQALYRDGRVLHAFLWTLGKNLSDRIHSRRAQDDPPQEELNRFIIDLGSVPPAIAEALRIGARHALFVAESTDASSLRYPVGTGIWRLAYFLSPRFWLLPRRGKVANLLDRQLQFEFGSDTWSNLELVEPSRDQLIPETVDEI
jgi:hypothetical protein